jgi:hypothetical protein
LDSARLRSSSPFLQREDQGLLGIGVLARLQDAARDLVVDGRHGEVDHHVHVRGGQEVVHRLRPHRELGGAQASGVHVYVRDRPEVEVPERRRDLEIGRRDVAAADDAHAEPGGGALASSGLGGCVEHGRHQP